MRISSGGGLPVGGAQSLQMLKAQQAWEARRAKQTQTTESKPPIQTESRLQEATSLVEPASGNIASPQWQKTVQEVQSIAQKAGFVGVSEQDIRRAYLQGESLLADYRV